MTLANNYGTAVTAKVLEKISRGVDPVEAIREVLEMLRPRSFTVRVTQEIIDNSVRNSSVHCMGADGIRACISGVYSIDVDVNSIRFNVGEVRYCFATPGELMKKIDEYDADLPVKPFTIKLEASQCTTALVVLRGKRVKVKVDGENPKATRKVRKHGVNRKELSRRRQLINGAFRPLLKKSQAG